MSAATLKGNDMDDLTATRLCAEAMGYELETITQDGPLHYRISGICTYEPLVDGNQAVELVKRFRMVIDPDSALWYVSMFDADIQEWHEDLNRAIVYCVAQMQAAKASIREGSDE